jgi:threonine dehydrogenase-like Zn-dependent dehydrogenase
MRDRVTSLLNQRADVESTDGTLTALMRAAEGRYPEIVSQLLLAGANVDAVAAIRDLTHGLGAELTLDTSASPEARIQAIRALKVWGTCCFVGEGNEVTIDVSPDMLRRQATVIASWTFSSIGQAECAQFIIDRGIKVDELFTESWQLDQAEEAYRLFDQQSSGKGVFLL